MEFPVFQFVLIVSFPVTGDQWQESASVLLTHQASLLKKKKGGERKEEKKQQPTKQTKSKIKTNTKPTQNQTTKSRLNRILHSVLKHIFDDVTSSWVPEHLTLNLWASYGFVCFKTQSLAGYQGSR